MIWAIHGFTGGPAAWKRIPAIPRGQCLTVLGHGPEALPGEGESFEREVTCLAAALPTSGVHLVGYSLGARLALAIALQAPQQITKLTLIGVHPGLRTEQERSARVASDRAWSELIRREGLVAFVDKWQALPLWESQERLPADLQAEQRALRLGHDADALATALDVLGTGKMPSMWERLPEITIEVELVVGQLDTKYRDLAEQMQRALPQAKCLVVANAGHNPLLENPQAISAILGAPPQAARVAQ